MADECTISFVIMPEHYGQSKVMGIDQSVAQIRDYLEKELAIPSRSLVLMHLTGLDSGTVEGTLQDGMTLRQYGVKPGGQIGIELKINYYDAPAAKEYVMPESFQITVYDQENRPAQVTVHVEKEQRPKAYLGGFRHKATGMVLHHAGTQTPKVKNENEQPKLKYHRDTQTVDQRTRSCQSKREAGTQMQKNGVYISDEHDKIMTPLRKAYFSSADLFALRLEKAVLIQCHTRGMFARKRARQVRQEREEREEFKTREAERKKLEAELRHKREIQRRMHPRTYEDFEILFKELEMWRVKETRRIKENPDIDKPTKQEALKQLLAKETRLLQTIDKLKIQAHRHNRAAKVQKHLETMAQPKVWAQSDAETTTVHTPFTTRAKELLDLYNGLNLPLLSIDERLDVLLHVKWTVKEFDCNLTRDIVDLIDREADMLNRGRAESSFSGLRRRLSNLFLQFVETPEFNPEALQFQTVPREMIKQTAVQPLSTVPLSSVAR